MVAVILTYPACSAWLRRDDSAGYRATIERAKERWRRMNASFSDMYLAIADHLEIGCGRPKQLRRRRALAPWFGASLLTKAPSNFSAFLEVRSAIPSAPLHQ